MAAPKIIVFGSLNGQLKPALTKLAALHAKNDFALAIFTGDVFAPDDDPDLTAELLAGSIQFPIPVYFSLGLCPLPPAITQKLEANQPICDNFFYLDKRSITTTAEGIRIVVLAGLLDSDANGDQATHQHLPSHSLQDAKTLRGANSAHVLLTSMWPAEIWTGSKVVLEPQQQAALQSSQPLAELCAALKPRYHLSASPDAFFYEREPFLHPAASDSDAVQSVTRFISMAPFGNTAKAKAMYAFSLNTADVSLPVGVTPSPFAAIHQHKKRRAEDSGSYSRFGALDPDPSDSYGRGHKRRRHAAPPPPGPDRCYFCLSNPNISAHMCCSIGDESYITTAKGPLLTSTIFADP
ncbi:hypothetical protein CDD82_6876 [Ophiocordyceps australis]|uniref:Cwf19-like C-terminal domain-containing protein n=1 Tax=Ophiocordyceps australis TaxID=1399860 RepID=A0A2C5YTC1_9HYPO|nr:hypothetical protein CDD82_6876 [Ophiocordyceps australis]